VTSDIGATPFGRWQFWQLRCRIGAMSFANVTSLAAGAGRCARPAAGASSASAATATPEIKFLDSIDTPSVP
jgi:hypothetical protein